MLVHANVKLFNYSYVSFLPNQNTLIKKILQLRLERKIVIQLILLYAIFKNKLILLSKQTK